MEKKRREFKESRDSNVVEGTLNNDMLEYSLYLKFMLSQLNNLLFTNSPTTLWDVY